MICFPRDPNHPRDASTPKLVFSPLNIIVSLLVGISGRVILVVGDSKELHAMGMVR